MPTLPRTDNSLFLRTDFQNEIAWVELCHEVQATNSEGFSAQLECVSDRRFENLSSDDVARQSNESRERSFCFLADQRTLTEPEHPVLVVDLGDEPGRTFRVVPRELWSVENNLSLGNMDFREFAAGADPDGVFRGFR
jgi:hypothetical protein